MEMILAMRTEAKIFDHFSNLLRLSFDKSWASVLGGLALRYMVTTTVRIIEIPVIMAMIPEMKPNARTKLNRNGRANVLLETGRSGYVKKITNCGEKHIRVDKVTQPTRFH